MKKAHILVVEDNETNRVFLNLILQDEYLVTLAENGTEALRIAKSSPRPQLILLDIVMPGIDGYEVCRRLKADPETEDILIIFFTSLLEEGGEYRGLSMGAVDYIAKPVQPQLLRIRIKQHLELLQARENLKKALKKEHLANLAKSEFLANMSHEMRTPMHAILSYANFGLQRIDKVPKAKLYEYFHEIKDSGNRMILLLNDLLDLSKLEAGSMEYTMEEQDMRDAAKSAVMEFKAAAEEKGIILTLDLPELPCTAWFDAVRIGQVLRNLLSNAIKFTNDGKEICVAVAKDQYKLDDRKERPVARITVKDQGIGVPTDELETIFDKFVQSSKSKTGAGGTGLGLSICKQIIMQHHGHIKAENKPEGGTLFSFVLPEKP